MKRGKLLSSTGALSACRPPRTIIVSDEGYLLMKKGNIWAGAIVQRNNPDHPDIIFVRSIKDVSSVYAPGDTIKVDNFSREPKR